MVAEFESAMSMIGPRAVGAWADSATENGTMKAALISTLQLPTMTPKTTSINKHEIFQTVVHKMCETPNWLEVQPIPRVVLLEVNENGTPTWK